MYKVFIITGKYNVESFKDQCFEDIDIDKVNCFKFKIQSMRKVHFAEVFSLLLTMTITAS